MSSALKTATLVIATYVGWLAVVAVGVAVAAWASPDIGPAETAYMTLGAVYAIWAHATWRFLDWLHS